MVTVETTGTLETVLTFGGPLIGVAIGAWGSARVVNGADRRAQRVELTRALASYLSAAELVAVELAAFPETSWFERQVDRLPKQRRLGFFMQTLIMRLAFGRRHDDRRKLYQDAKANVVLVAPIELIVTVSEVDDVLTAWQTERGPEVEQRWVEALDALRLVSQRTVDEGQGRSYRAGEPPLTSEVGRRERIARWAYKRLSGHERPPA